MKASASSGLPLGRRCAGWKRPPVSHVSVGALPRHPVAPIRTTTPAPSCQPAALQHAHVLMYRTLWAYLVLRPNAPCLVGTRLQTVERRPCAAPGVEQFNSRASAGRLRKRSVRRSTGRATAPGDPFGEPRERHVLAVFWLDPEHTAAAGRLWTDKTSFTRVCVGVDYIRA